MTDTLDGAAVTAAANLGREAAYATPITLATGEEIDSTLIVRVVDTEHNVEIHDLEAYLQTPRHARGEAAIHDADSFAKYVTRIVGDPEVTGAAATAYASLWADDQTRRVTCVFNDHATRDNPGWRDLRATFTARVDADWERWRNQDTKLLSQLEFGEFLQDMAHTIVEPSAASLVQTAMTFTAKRGLQFESAARIDTGDINLVYRESTKAEPVKGNIEVPSAIVIRTPVFYGRYAVDISARIRYRITEGGLRIGYALQRPDIAEREAFDEIVASIDSNTPDIHFMMGTAPSRLR